MSHRSALLFLSLLAPPGAAAERVESAAVLEATLRQQIGEHLDASDRARETVVCLGIDGGKGATDPGESLMAAFEGEGAVRRLSECERRREGAVLKRTSRPAITITAGPIEWRAADEAWVKVAYFRSARLSAWRTYRVVREDSAWVCLGQIVIDTPA